MAISADPTIARSHPGETKNEPCRRDLIQCYAIHHFFSRPAHSARGPSQAFVHRSRGIVVGVSMAWRRPEHDANPSPHRRTRSRAQLRHQHAPYRNAHAHHRSLRRRRIALFRRADRRVRRRHGAPRQHHRGQGARQAGAPAGADRQRPVERDPHARLRRRHRSRAAGAQRSRNGSTTARSSPMPAARASSTCSPSRSANRSAKR